MARFIFLHESEKKMNRDCSVVIPVHNESKDVVENIYHSLIKEGFEVIVVDDGSTMPELDIPTLFYFPHKGYGYALKTGIKAATNDLIITMDGDGEHRVEDAIKLYTVFKFIDNCSMLIGCRWNKKESKIRWFGRKVINFFAACLSRHMLPDLNSGMRIFSRRSVMGYFPILCDTFSFTTSITMAMVTDNHKVFWFPIETNSRSYGKSHVKLWKDGWVTVFYVIWIGFALRTRKLRAFLRKFYLRRNYEKKNAFPVK